MGLETLTSHRDKVKLKWWYKLASMPARRYPRQLFNQEWKVKSCRGRQKKPWKCNKSQAGTLEAILLEGAKRFLDACLGHVMR